MDSPVRASPARIRPRLRGQQNGENTPHRADANGQTQSWPTHSRPKCGREMGQRGQASGPRTRPRVPPRVRRNPTWRPHCLDPSSSPRVLATLCCRFGLVPRAVSLDVAPGRLRVSMTALGGEWPGARVLHLYKGNPLARRPPTPAATVPPHPTSTP
jgi:hypothetical protein